MQTRLKLKTRISHDAIVGAVTGTLARPERLILGVMTPDGVLVVAGGTGPLKPLQQRAVAALLEPPAGRHPWPSELPAGRTGIVGGGPRRLGVTLVDPTLVVEVEADQAYEHRRWRHLTRLRRLRPDLDPREIVDPDAAL